ncbi:MAG: GatB/YqeY domain-containing protein [Longimicrobiales bacterium]
MAETLKERLRTNLNDARRQRDKLRTLVLTTILSDLRNREIEQGHDASDADVIEIVNRGIKRRREASEQMRAGNRLDLAEKEDQEAAILAVYLPAQLGESEVRAFIKEAMAEGAQSVGAIMGKIASRIKGRFDGKEANRIVQEELKG